MLDDHGLVLGALGRLPPGPGAPRRHDLPHRGHEEELAQERLEHGQALAGVARGNQVAVPGRREGHEAEEQVLAHRALAVGAEEGRGLDRAHRAVGEGEGHPDQQVGGQRAEHRLLIDRRPVGDVPDDRHGGDHVQQAGGDEDEPTQTRIGVGEQVDHPARDGNDEQDVRHHEQTPPRLGGAQRQPHRADLDEHEDRRPPPLRERRRHHVRDDDHDHDQPVAVGSTGRSGAGAGRRGPRGRWPLPPRGAWPSRHLRNAAPPGPDPAGHIRAWLSASSDPERHGRTSPGSGDFAARLPPYGRP